MPKSKQPLTELEIRKHTRVFGDDRTGAKLVLVCECGQKKTIITNPIEVQERQIARAIGGDQIAVDYDQPVATIRIDRLEWHCTHEDVK